MVGNRSPKIDPKRTKATLEQLGRLHAHLQQMMQALRQEVSNSFGQQFQNIKSLEGGVNSAEYNMRAQQKVINALAMDVKALYDSMATVATPPALLRIDTPEGQRIDWAYYHAQVDADLAVVQRLRAEAEAKAKEDAEKLKAAAQQKELEDLVEKVKTEAEASGNDPEEVAEAARQLLEETKKVSDETGKMLRGEDYDESVILEAQKKIEEDAKNHPSEFPEGASIFGG